MNSVSTRSRTLFSTWFSLFFFTLLILYVLFIEFFQDTNLRKSVKNLVSNPIKEDIISNVKSLRFKNRLGKFTLNIENNNWVLKEPRVMPAKIETVSSILKSLEKISVYTIHQLEPINIQSFSLDKPTIEIDIYTKLDEKVNIKFGIINPINNTSYVQVSGKERIYQINLFKNKFDSLDLSDFIDSRIFSLKVSDVQRFQLFQYKSNKPFNDLTLINDTWKSGKYNTISNNSVETTLKNIFNINTHMIIDKMNDKLENFINNYLDNPLYKIIITNKDKTQISYTVSTAIKAVPELKLEKRQYFLIKASNKPYPYVINRSYLSRFQIRYSNLK